MSKMWVEVKVKNYKQSLAVLNFLLDVAKRPRTFKSEDLLNFEGVMKSSLRILVDLRSRCLVEYEVIDRKWGVYQLNSTFNELLQAKEWVEAGGYCIEETEPVLSSNAFAFPVEQLSLL